MCACGHKMDMPHAVKGGFITIGDNDAQDLTCNLLTMKCKDVEIESKLLLINR